MSRADPEYVTYFPKLLAIVYQHMIGLYVISFSKGAYELLSEVNTENILPDVEELNELYQEVT